MTNIKRALLALALCMAAVSVAHAQQASTPNDSKLDALFPGTSGAKQQLAAGKDVAATPNAGVVGKPVKCSSTGWVDGGTAHLIVKKLNPAAGTVDIAGVSTKGVPWGGTNRINSFWKFRDGVLDYQYYGQYKIHLVVGERNLTGSFFDSEAPKYNREHVDYVCDGPLERIIVR